MSQVECGRVSSCADCLSSLSKRTEAHRYAPFVDAINRVLEKLENLSIEGLKETLKGAGGIIFLANHPHQIPIESAGALSHRKPDVVVIRLDDATRAYSVSQSTDWGQLKTIARSGVKPRSFQRILSCVEFRQHENGESS